VTETLVRFSSVQKSYDGENLIVKDLNLDVLQGEFLTLLGPSGSGKTTCLMMLAGFETPTSGQITMGGQILNSIPPHKRNIGMVFQNYALFPHLTVAENLRFPLKVRKVPTSEIDIRVKKTLKMIRLDNLKNRYPSQLSGGQQQRVALARALIFEPRLVLMDEPLGALDKQLREHMQLELRHLHQELGLTVVFVTHDQSEALTMSDRVAVFDDGMIQQIDRPNTLYEEPSNVFVANFIGENNSLPGQVESIQDEFCSVRLNGGASIQALRGNINQAGESVIVSVRPERALLTPCHQNTKNCLSATICEIIYLGDHVRIRVELAGNPDFMIKASASEWNHNIQVGNSVDLSIDPAYARTLLSLEE